MKNRIKLLVVLAIAVVSSGLVFRQVSAQGGSAAKPEKVVEAQNVKGGNQNVVKTQTGTETAVTTQAVEGQTDQDKKDKPKKKVKLTGEGHRSAVATFVQSLLAVADREGGIGQEVRAIAQQQNDAKDRTSDIINAVEGRSKVKTFFIGTSYKNLGEMRKQMVQSRNQIEQLKRLIDKTENEQDKIELQAQIQVLEQQQTSIDNFITSNESKFSLFGWAVKMFRK